MSRNILVLILGLEVIGAIALDAHVALGAPRCQQTTLPDGTAVVVCAKKGGK